MITIELQQGSPEWHQFRATKFTASDAPAMLGLSKYKTRQQLLHEKATGLTEEVTPQMQALFDKGHSAEAAARPIVEAQIGQDLYPVTGVCDLPDLDFLAASFDGLTMCESVCWEHKLFNAKLADYIEDNEDLPDSHWPQVEHQLIVSGADYCHFTVSDGTGQNKADIEYLSRNDRRKVVIDGWLQFAKDLSVYVPEEKQEAVKAEVIRDLPALTFDFDRANLTIRSNIVAYKQAASDLVEQSKRQLESDQDFANAESMVKFFKTAEEKLLTITEMVIGEVSDIDGFIKDVKEIMESIRSARLNREKQVKTRKESIKLEIVQAAQQQLAAHVAAAEDTIGFTLPRMQADFAVAIKGKKTVQSLKDACADELARAKIEVDNQAAIIRRNSDCIQQHGKGLNFLFNDFTQIYLKDPADFILLVQSRVNEYEAEQARKAEAEKQRQEQIRLQREAAEIAEQQRQDELKRQQEAAAAQQAVNHPEPEQPAVQEQKTAPSIGELAKQVMPSELANIFKESPITLASAIDSFCSTWNLPPDAQSELIETLSAFGIDV